jgi:hypothetical protein
VATESGTTITLQFQNTFSEFVTMSTNNNDPAPFLAREKVDTSEVHISPERRIQTPIDTGEFSARCIRKHLILRLENRPNTTAFRRPEMYGCLTLR